MKNIKIIIQHISVFRLVFISLILCFSLNLSAQQLSVEGGNMVITGGLNLSEDMSLNIDGVLNSKGGSTISFRGNASQQIFGSGAIGFNNLIINNSSTGVVLQRNISLVGDLTMTDGDLDILDYSLSLGLNGDIIGENPNSMIKSTSGNGSYTPNSDAGDGTITRTINISSSGVSNIAGLGISITPTTDWGSCQVSRSHQREIGFDGDNSVFRKITISPTNSANLKASLIIKYNSTELNGHTAGNLKVFQLINNGAKGIEWQELNSSDNGSEVSATAFDNDGSELTITLAESSDVLPISLLDFSSYCDNGLVRLQWQTVSEINNNFFILEKSIDGISFLELAIVNGNGTTNSLSSYEITDYNETSEVTYYRLSQMDYDGETTTYNTIASQCANENKIDFVVVNPAQDEIQFFSSEPLINQFDIVIFDVAGRIIIRKKLHINQSNWTLPIDDFNSGVYYIRFSSTNQIINKAITITKQ
ncbi:MAG: T9SS type A sorting domain-containing protein [Saprospiraceae bacterium]|nr:T9SS type A sorting domain-containing protein [Saprospiraceae bacterium]